MRDEFMNKYQDLTPHENFSMSRAIMTMIEDNKNLYEFTGADFELAVDFVTRAWNLAIINDLEFIKILIKKDIKELQEQIDKPAKQIQKTLLDLIKLKNKLYADVFRLIGDYDPSFKDGKPYLRVASGADMPADHFAKHYREKLFGKQKYGWVRNEDL